MARNCPFCKHCIPNYTHGCGWCTVHKHVVDDDYSCGSFNYIECCAFCHYFAERNGTYKCVKGHPLLYTDRCMCADEYEERIDL